MWNNFDPIKNELFFAEKNNGSFLNNSRIRVSSKKKLKDCLLVTGGAKKLSKNKENIFSEYKMISDLVDAPIRKFGSASLDIANVACVDLMVIGNLKLIYGMQQQE